jgi:hypothetical protein
MSPYLVAGLAAGILGIALGAGVTHRLDGAALAREQASHQADLAKINAASAKALSEALVKQQAAEGQVASVEAQFNEEVGNHAKDNLALRAQLASGAQRLRVRITGCSVAPASQGPAAAGSADDAAAYADLDPTVASGVVQVAADDQAEIDKLAALQAYVKALQDQGYIGK